MLPVELLPTPVAAARLSWALLGCRVSAMLSDCRASPPTTGHGGAAPAPVAAARARAAGTTTATTTATTTDAVPDVTSGALCAPLSSLLCARSAPIDSCCAVSAVSAAPLSPRCASLPAPPLRPLCALHPALHLTPASTGATIAVTIAATPTTTTAAMSAGTTTTATTAGTTIAAMSAVTIAGTTSAAMSAATTIAVTTAVTIAVMIAVTIAVTIATTTIAATTIAATSADDRSTWRGERQHPALGCGCACHAQLRPAPISPGARSLSLQYNQTGERGRGGERVSVEQSLDFNPPCHPNYGFTTVL